MEIAIWNKRMMTGGPPSSLTSSLFLSEKTRAGQTRDVFSLYKKSLQLSREGEIYIALTGKHSPCFRRVLSHSSSLQWGAPVLAGRPSSCLLSEGRGERERETGNPSLNNHHYLGPNEVRLSRSLSLSLYLLS